MQNSMVLFTFPFFRRETPFLGKLGAKNQNCQFKLKFGTYTSSNMQNSMVVITFSVFTKDSLIGQIWSKESNLSVSAEIWCLGWLKNAECNAGIHFFIFRQKTLFLGKFGPKKSKLSVYTEIWYLDKFEYAKFDGCVHFFCFKPETPFLVNEGKRRATIVPATLWE